MGSRLLSGFDAPGELGDRRRFEQGSKRQVRPEGVVHPRDHRGTEQRVPSESEEVVMDANRNSAQQGFPKSHQLRLQHATRGHVLGAQGRTLVIGPWKRLPVQLPVHQRQRRQEYER